MKKLFSIIFAILLSIILTACGTSEVDRTTLTDQSLNSGSDSTTIEQPELTWPDDLMSESVPELKGISITTITDSGTALLIAFEDCDSEKTKLYINELTGAGWDIETSNDETGKIVTAGKQNEILIFISSPVSETGSITYSKID